MGKNGQRYLVDTELDLESLEKDLKEVKQKTGIQSIAVVLMHSYAMPEHELKIGKLCKDLGFT